MSSQRELDDGTMLALINQAKKSGGGSGTSDYNNLSNKPHIEGHALSGNKTAEQLGLVKAEAGKGLSSNDFTDSEKEKLDDIVNIKSIGNGLSLDVDGKLTGTGNVEVDDDLSTTSTNPVQNKVLTSALNKKADYVEGKSLSTNDFSDEYKEKLENMPEIKNVGDGLSLDNGTLSSSSSWEDI